MMSLVFTVDPESMEDIMNTHPPSHTHIAFALQMHSHFLETRELGEKPCIFTQQVNSTGEIPPDMSILIFLFFIFTVRSKAMLLTVLLV